GNDLNGHAQKGMAVAGGIIYVFSFFFILYSMSSFLNFRKKDFGLLMIQGLSNLKIRWMVFWEIMLMGLFEPNSGLHLELDFSLVLSCCLSFYHDTVSYIVPFLSLTFYISSFFYSVYLYSEFIS